MFYIICLFVVQVLCCLRSDRGNEWELHEGITARSRAKPVALEKRGKKGGGGGGSRGTVVTERKASE